MTRREFAVIAAGGLALAACAPKKPIAPPIAGPPDFLAQLRAAKVPEGTEPATIFRALREPSAPSLPPTVLHTK